VRLTAPDCQLQKQPATLVSFEDDILSASVGDTEIQCPFGALTKLEVSLGERVWQKDAVKGMKYGALLGLAAGVAIIASADRENESAAGDAALAVAGLGATGFLVGAGISAIRGREEWLEAPLPLPRPSVFLVGRDRLHLGFTLRVRN
jgi:hypothetical protein